MPPAGCPPHSTRPRPTGSSYVVFAGEEGKRAVGSFGFGLIPSWAKDRKMQYSTTNARDDKLMESNLWRPLFEKKRCIVPANGFYEHHHLSGKIDIPGARKPTDKVPYYFKLKS
jgi:putative SOS response-associated peptidase YedK